LLEWIAPGIIIEPIEPNKLAAPGYEISNHLLKELINIKDYFQIKKLI